MKTTPTIIINKSANHVALVAIFYGIFLAITLLCFVNPFFQHLLIFLSVMTTIASVGGCIGAYNDKKNGVKRSRPTQKRFFPKWSLHAFFGFMIMITAGLKLGYYIVPLCWVISWVALYSGIQHIKATYEDEKEVLDPCDPRSNYGK